MVLLVGLLSKHRSRMQIQRASLEICALAQAVGLLLTPEMGDMMLQQPGELTLQIFLPPDLFQRLSQQKHIFFSFCVFKRMGSNLEGKQHQRSGNIYHKR